MKLDEMFDAAVKVKAPPPDGELVCVKEDGWWRIRRGQRLIAILPGAYTEERDAILKALREVKACKK